MSPKDKKNYSKVSGVASRIAQAILESGISQAEIAKKMSCFPTAISRWKTGSTEPTPANLNAIAKVLKIDVNWLMSGQGQAIKSITNPVAEDQDMLRQELITAYKKLIERDERIFYLEEKLREKPNALVGITTKKRKA